MEIVTLHTLLGQTRQKLLLEMQTSRKYHSKLATGQCKKTLTKIQMWMAKISLQFDSA